jgi:hypothetical protein
MTAAGTTTAQPSKLYVRENPCNADSIEIMHLALDPDGSVWLVHFYGDATTAPPDIFSADPGLEALTDDDQMWQGDFDQPEGLDGFHALITAADGDGHPFYGSGWTLLPCVPEQ